MTHYGSFLGRGGGDTLTKSVMGLAKPSQYNVDGNGRDSYINLNNGGLYKFHEVGSAMDVGTFSSKKVK